MPKEKKVEPIEVVGYVDSNYIVDLAKDDLGLCFWEQNGTVPKRVLGSRPKQNLHLIPIRDPFSIIGRVVSLPSEAKHYKSQQELLERMINFIHTYLDCSPQWEHLIAHYCLLTWVYDAFTSLPYLRFLGDYESGKTRALRICHRLSHKGIMTMGASTSSPIFRMLEQYKGTLILDEADWKSSDMRNDLIQIINQGYTSDGYVLRSHGQNHDSRPFSVYGPKIIANRARFDDEALESRCLTIQDSDRELRLDIPRQLPPKFDEEALEIRNQLLQWRFDNLKKIVIDEEPLKHLSPRDCETGSTLYSISKDEGFKEWLIQFLHDRGKKEKEDRPKIRVARIIVETCRPDMPYLYKEIVAAYNSSADDQNEHISPKKLGTYIKSLGIMNVKRTEDGYSFIPSNSDIERLKHK